MIVTLKEYLSSFRHIAIVSHREPDGDALGSSLALWGALKSMGCKATVANSSPLLERKYSFLEGFSVIKKELPTSCDCVVLVDCSTMSRTGFDFSCEIPCVVIDHHQTATPLSKWDCIDTKACSTAAILYQLFESWGLIYNKHIATALYVGVAEDTNFFQKRVDKNVFDVAASLMGKGVNGAEVAKKITQQNSLAKIRLKGLAFKEMELLNSGEIAFVYLSQEMLESTGATFYDCNEIVDEMSALAVVEIAMIIRFNGAGSLKVSLRSKSIDVSKIAYEFGGGGHILSSGFEIACNNEDEYKMIRDKIVELIQGV